MYVYCIKCRKRSEIMVVCMATSHSRHPRARSKSTSSSFSKFRYYRNQLRNRRSSAEETRTRNDLWNMGHGDDADTMLRSESNQMTSLEDRIKAIVLDKRTENYFELSPNVSNEKGQGFGENNVTPSTETNIRRSTGQGAATNAALGDFAPMDRPRSKSESKSKRPELKLKNTRLDRTFRSFDSTNVRSSSDMGSGLSTDLRERSTMSSNPDRPGLIPRSRTVDDVLLQTNESSSNITDSEKIYHKLRGITKVTRHKSLYVPKCNRNSLVTESLSTPADDCAKVTTKHVPKKHRGSQSSVRKRKNDAKERKQESAKETIKIDHEDCLEVRQCRIGSSLAFGLVQTKKMTPNGNGYSDGHGLVTIKMKPDEQGRFGFNVKGGADQGMPIIVSRVAPNTPADLAIPRLNEGDQVLYINGRDVSQHTHEQVVMFIRASRETHSGELVLIVRPNVYVGEDPMEEPAFSYDPESLQITTPGGANALEASLLLLQESLESGAALAQFEQLYRKKPGMTMNAARMEANLAKNRYRDISPYDQTRVILKDPSGNSGDYINANYVNMEIPGSGIVNRYIAAQGPLPKTCTDFWQMVWEQHSSLVVMLTTKVERGRVKCHQYWPDLYETMDYGAIQITCVKEEETSSFAFREFNLLQVETQEERHISHMQYIAWPDHGVPDDPADFLEFVLKVRQRRTGMVEPTIVHCSAGIGRTGVLITMETAMCLIEANQPVYPLSIVRQMRDQRAMLIQTASQYKFVCEAILKVYNEGLVKPLEDYQR